MVSADDGVSVADRLEHSLDPAWIEMQRLIGWILWAVLTPLLLTGLIVAWFTRSLSLDIKALLGLLWLAAVILLAWTAQKWPAIQYRYFRYVLDADGIEIRCGVVWRKLIRVPRSRVQHIDVDSGAARTPSRSRQLVDPYGRDRICPGSSARPALCARHRDS